MKVKANDLGICGVQQLFYAGKLAHDTEGATDGVVICKVPHRIKVTRVVADVTTAFSGGKISLTAGEDDTVILADSVATATTKGTYSADAFVDVENGGEIKAKLSAAANAGEVEFYIFAVGIPEE